MKNNLRRIASMYAGIILCFLLLTTPFSSIVVSGNINLNETTEKLEMNEDVEILSHNQPEDITTNYISISESNIRKDEQDVIVEIKLFNGSGEKV